MQLVIHTYTVHVHSHTHGVDTYVYFPNCCQSCSLCAGVENYSPGGVHLLVGDSMPLPHGPHPPGHAESLAKQQLLAQCICACRVIKQAAICTNANLVCRVSHVVLIHNFNAVLCTSAAML